MSWLRTTIDSVSKAVGSTNLISKFSRFKPSNVTADSGQASKERFTSAMLNSSSAAAGSPPKAEMKAGVKNMTDKSDGQKITEVPYIAVKKANRSAPSPSTSVAQQTLQLFHPSALSASMDEIYKTLSHHINSYFGAKTQEEGTENCQQERKEEFETAPHKTRPALSPVSETESTEGPATSPFLSSPSEKPFDAEGSTHRTATFVISSKTSSIHHMPYPRPTVQDFVGSYIAPLVPKVRGDSGRAGTKTDEGLAAVIVSKPTAKKVAVEEEKTEKAKQQLLTQREKIIARVSVDNRTRSLVRGLQRINDAKLLTNRVEELNFHLLEFPESCGVAIKERVLPSLLRLREVSNLPLQAAARQALAMVGYTDPVKGRGIRVLAIDGGGTRGLLALQILYKLQQLTGKQIHELFDYICGVSTGAIMAFMLGIYQISLEECETLYRKLGSDVFNQNVFLGTVKMGWSHAFYDSEMWESILKERLGKKRMIESARDLHCPKVSAVSTIVNRGLPLKAFLFRNYRLMPGVRSHYLGDCRHQVWQAIRASSAAPGYFEEFVLGRDLHQDGGLLINNPTALAIHECKCLWPDTPLQCVVSLGTGRHESAGKNNTLYTSLKTKLTNVISSATDTEEVHTMLHDLLPSDVYFRFNPFIGEDIPLNESREEKLNFLKSEGERYLGCNDAKLKKAARVLVREKGAVQRLKDWAKLKADMYEGLMSKL